MLNKEKFGQIMSGMAGMYNIIITEFTLDTYYEIFKDYSDDQFSRAVTQTIREHKYSTLPKPAEILEYLEGTRDDKALIAWYQLMEAVKKGGYHASIEFADPLIPHIVNELGGWMWFCCTQKEELPFIQKRFEDLYRLFLKRQIQPINQRLIGFYEAQNIQSGKEITPPIRIGFAEITKQIEMENND